MSNITEVKILDWIQDLEMPKLCLDDLCLDEVTYSVYAHQQQLVKYVDSYGRINISISTEETRTAIKNNQLVKIEGFEKFSPQMLQVCRQLAQTFGHNGPVTAHVFISPKDSTTFHLHTDPDDVIIYVVDGIKVMDILKHTVSEKYTIETGKVVLIPKHKLHRGINVNSSIMISFGLEDFTQDKLHYA